MPSISFNPSTLDLGKFLQDTHHVLLVHLGAMTAVLVVDYDMVNFFGRVDDMCRMGGR